MYRVIAASLMALAAVPATAQTISINLNESHFGLPDFYTVGTTFNLPANFTDARLSISSFNVDDRSVLVLNGTIVASEGIFGPGAGAMVLTPGGANTPFTFDYGPSGPFLPITSGFVAGTNTLDIVVNDTNVGIGGNLSGGINCGFAACAAPTSVVFAAEVSFNTSAVPLPASVPLFGAGLLAVALGAKRRRPAVA